MAGLVLGSVSQLVGV